jgi:hypothetical protein
MILFISLEFFLFFIKLVPFWILAVLIQMLIQNQYYKKMEKQIEEHLKINDSIGVFEGIKSTIERKVDFHLRKLLFMRSSIYFFEDCLYIKSYSKFLFKNAYKPFLIQLFDTVNNENNFKYILTNISFDNQDLVIRFNKINERKSFEISFKLVDGNQKLEIVEAIQNIKRI